MSSQSTIAGALLLSHDIPKLLSKNSHIFGTPLPVIPTEVHHQVLPTCTNWWTYQVGKSKIVLTVPPLVGGQNWRNAKSKKCP